MFADCWLGLLLIVIFLVRIFCLKRQRVLLFCLVSAIIPITVFSIKLQAERRQRETIRNYRQDELTVNILPGEINERNGSFHGNVYSPSLKQRILIHGFFRDQCDGQKLIPRSGQISLRVSGELSRLDSAPNFNQFNPQNFYREKGIFGQFQLKYIESNPSPLTANLWSWMANLKYRAVKSADCLPKRLKIYVLGLVFGLKDNDFHSELSGFTTLNLIHLFTISGMHVFFMLSLIRKLLTLVGVEREKINYLLLVFLPGYFWLANAGTSLLRSVLMNGIRIGSQQVKFHVSGLEVWSLALMVNLLINPTLPFQFGCQLSYLMSLALIISRRQNYLKQTVLLNLVSLPIILYWLFEWHVLSLFANFLIVPLFSTLLFPAIMIGYGCGLLKLHFVCNGIELILEWFDEVMKLIGNLPGKIIFGKPHWLLACFLVILALLMMEKLTKQRLGLFIGMLAAAFLLIHFPVTGQACAFDVGQGDSFFISQPFHQQTTLIDTGGKVVFGKQAVKRPPFYQAAGISINYLKSQGIGSLDNICLSHQDADHVADLPAFLSEMKVKRVYIPWGMSRNSNFMKRIAPYQGRFQLTEVKAGDAITDKINVVHPFKPGKGENEDSMVLLAVVGNTKWLFMGDLPRTQEMEILTKYPKLSADVLKLGHHGSKTSSEPAFLKAVKPSLGIISAGRSNRYGHPNEETLDTLTRFRIPYLSTQKNGMIKYVFGTKADYFETKWKKSRYAGS